MINIFYSFILGNFASINTQVNTNSMITNAVSTAIINNSSQCSTTAINNIDFNLGNVKGDLVIDGANLSQQINLNMSCLSSSVTNTQIQNDIKNSLTQSLAALSGNLLSANTNVNTNNAINNFASNFNINNVKTCLANSQNNTNISSTSVGGNVSIKNITVNQVQDIVSKCILKDNATTVLNNALQQEIGQSTTNNSILMYIIIAIAAIIILIIIASIFKGKNAEVSK